MILFCSARDLAYSSSRSTDLTDQIGAIGDAFLDTALETACILRKKFPRGNMERARSWLLLVLSLLKNVLILDV
jgi:hypothetical protein